MAEHPFISFTALKDHPGNCALKAPPRLNDRLLHIIGVFYDLVELVRNPEKGCVRIGAYLKHQVDV